MPKTLKVYLILLSQMNVEFYRKTDYKTVLYAFVRVAFSGYLLVDAVIETLNHKFLSQASLSKPFEGGFSDFVTELAPVIFMIEFFISGMMFIGIYTKISLTAMLGVFTLHMILFYSVGATEAVISEGYALSIALTLLIFVSYNKFSLDFYHIWQTEMESHRLKDKIKERR
ncbi:MAG: hypothetical protein NWQ19_10800 [Nonlabens sp.]|nr:hypothetical protein [Nonlabens sp.]